MPPYFHSTKIPALNFTWAKKVQGGEEKDFKTEEGNKPAFRLNAF